MKKISFLILVCISFLSADTMKEKMYKMNSEGTCKTLFQSIMSANDRQVFYSMGMNTDNLLVKEDEYIIKEVITILKYSNNLYFNCVSIPYANTLLLKMVFVSNRYPQGEKITKKDVLGGINFQDFTNKLYK